MTSTNSISLGSIFDKVSSGLPSFGIQDTFAKFASATSAPATTPTYGVSNAPSFEA